MIEQVNQTCLCLIQMLTHLNPESMNVQNSIEKLRRLIRTRGLDL